MDLTAELSGAPSHQQQGQGALYPQMNGFLAFSYAQRQRAKSLALRATTSLACLWQSQDKQREAHQMLAEVYGWFTEGFDTKDLQEAKALLKELGREFLSENKHSLQP
jgi:predicted ATPase